MTLWESNLGSTQGVKVGYILDTEAQMGVLQPASDIGRPGGKRRSKESNETFKRSVEIKMASVTK